MKFNVSVPDGIPEGISGKVSDETLNLKLQNAKMSVQFHTYQKYGSSFRLEKLGIWISFDTYNEDFSFNPDGVILQVNNTEMKAQTFIGPRQPWRSPRAAARGCGPRKYSLGWSTFKLGVSIDELTHGNSSKGVYKTSDNPIPFKGKKCFYLWFDTYADPEYDYVIKIQGLRHMAKAVYIPEIKFKKGSVTKNFTII